MTTDVAAYFCDPRSPWQRGTTANTNGLLRQHFPDGTDLSVFTQRELHQVARRLHTRPRKTLGYRSPATVCGGCGKDRLNPPGEDFANAAK